MYCYSPVRTLLPLKPVHFNGTCGFSVFLNYNFVCYLHRYTVKSPAFGSRLNVVPNVITPTTEVSNFVNAVTFASKYLQLCSKNLSSFPSLVLMLHSNPFGRQKPYEGQKSSLQQELEVFLASLPSPKTFVTASPDDLIRFLIWKDKSGKTRVHRDSCPFFGSSAKRTACPCPTLLAAGTVDNCVAKLKALYSSLGSTTTSDSSSLAFSNPASHPRVAKYLTCIR